MLSVLLKDGILVNSIKQARIFEIKQLIFENVKILPECINWEIAEYATGYVFDCEASQCKEEIFITDGVYQFQKTIDAMEKLYCNSCKMHVKNLCLCPCFQYHPSNKDAVLNELIETNYVKLCANHGACNGIICEKCNRLLYENSDFCPVCYAQQQEMPTGFMTFD